MIMKYTLYAEKCSCLLSSHLVGSGVGRPCSLLRPLRLPFMLRVNVKCIPYFPPTSHGVSSVSSLSSLLPISLTACCSSSSAYNWIRVWNRRAVGSEIKEGRLSLHLRRGKQIFPTFPLFSFLPLLISTETETGNENGDRKIPYTEHSGPHVSVGCRNERNFEGGLFLLMRIWGWERASHIHLLRELYWSCLMAVG